MQEKQRIKKRDGARTTTTTRLVEAASGQSHQSRISGSPEIQSQGHTAGSGDGPCPRSTSRQPFVAQTPTPDKSASYACSPMLGGLFSLAPSPFASH